MNNIYRKSDMPENGRIRNRSDRILAGRFHDFRKYWSIDTESSHFYGMHLHLQNFAFYPAVTQLLGCGQVI